MQRKLFASVAIVALLAGCGGGGNGGGGGNAIVVVPPPPTAAPPATPAGCSLRERQDWAAAQLQEWYLFPELLASGLNPASYSTVQDYIDALVAPARAQGRDRDFTHITSIAEENAFYQSGATAGYGFRLLLDQGGRLLVTETFENTPALAAGIDRGTQIVGIGTSESNLRSVESILQSEGVNGLITALGPDTTGTSRVFQLRYENGPVRVTTVAKVEFEIDPVSDRYGALIFDHRDRKVGYLNLRTFISTADAQLREAFGQFRAAGVTEVIIDVRYNGGGLLSTAAWMGDLLGANRLPSDVFAVTTFRAQKSAQNETRFFQPQPQSIAPMRLAFIGTDSTASASELVINSMIPYLKDKVALIGSNTYGKPVGQIALDRPACDDRLRVVAFRTVNASGQGDYYQGLANVMPVTCAANDELRPFGDRFESSTARAIQFLDGEQCQAISSGGITAQGQRAGKAEPLTPARPTAAQREVRGLF